MRRTQAERRAATRGARVPATRECWGERGTANTTPTLISARAGVSRGAQLHHFPTKQELVSAAVAHLFERRRAEFREAFGSLPEGADKIDAALDLLWGIFSSPTYYAWLELVVAARTDDVLRPILSSLAAKLDAEMVDDFTELFGAPPGGTESVRAMGTLLFSTLEGLSYNRILQPDTLPYQTVITMLKGLGHMAMPSLGSDDG